MDKFKKAIGQKIRERRVELGYKSQGEFAHAFGTDQSRVSRWETGGALPDKAYRRRLAEFLKVEEDFFDLPRFDDQGSVENSNDSKAIFAEIREIHESIRQISPRGSGPPKGMSEGDFGHARAMNDTEGDEKRAMALYAKMKLAIGRGGINDLLSDRLVLSPVKIQAMKNVDALNYPRVWDYLIFVAAMRGDYLTDQAKRVFEMSTMTENSLGEDARSGHSKSQPSPQSKLTLKKRGKRA